jgi:hypothetical protein
VRTPVEIPTTSGTPTRRGPGRPPKSPVDNASTKTHVDIPTVEIPTTSPTKKQGKLHTKEKQKQDVELDNEINKTGMLYEDFAKNFLNL